MRPAYAGDVALEVDVIHALTVLTESRSAADPRELPTALILREGAPAADRLLSALGPVSLVQPEKTSLLVAWLPRARLLRALQQVEPLEAIRLQNAAATDGRLWTVVHAAEACSVAEHGKRTPASRAAENVLLSGLFVQSHCDARCVDEDDHEWDEREITDEDGQAIDDTICTRCGVASDHYWTWRLCGLGGHYYGDVEVERELNGVALAETDFIDS
jgi:hypothetical protein